MKFLAIDTAGPAVEAALSTGAYFYDDDNRNASASLMPAVDRLLGEASLMLDDLDFIACVVGPGSFTGIRIGVSAVRSMCYARGKKALGMHGLQMLAYNERADGADKILCVTDGSNGTAYIAEFDGKRAFVRPCECVPLAEAVQRANEYDGIVCVDEKLAALLPQAVPPQKDGSTLIRAAKALCAAADDYTRLLPVYVRESQAERDLREKERAGVS